LTRIAWLTAGFLGSLVWAVPAEAARTVSFRAADGTHLSASLYEPDRRPAPAVVLIHMLTRTRGDWDDTARRLRDGGFVALALDLRGHGESSGARPDGAALGPMLQDVQAALAFVKAQGVVATGRVGLAGASAGANLAAMAAGGDKSVRSLVLLSATTDYRGLKTEAALRRFAGSVLFLAGSNDSYALRSARVLAGSTTFRHVETFDGAGHGTVMLQRRPDLVDRLVNWFRQTLL
jgi:alpha-beta hydrolase superfamily lysophospholipase